MSRVFCPVSFLSLCSCIYILIDIKDVNISLILVFNVVKTSVYSDNGKGTGHCRYINYQNKGPVSIRPVSRPL